jgi:hypothetical protein
MADWTAYLCQVNEVGPAGDASETPEPVIYINLTDTKNAFKNTWFYAELPIQNQVLDVGIAAISGHKHVWVGAVPPDPGNQTFTGIWRIYLQST